MEDAAGERLVQKSKLGVVLKHGIVDWWQHDGLFGSLVLAMLLTELAFVRQPRRCLSRLCC
jgi:hypothetical protein